MYTYVNILLWLTGCVFLGRTQNIDCEMTRPATAKHRVSLLATEELLCRSALIAAEDGALSPSKSEPQLDGIQFQPISIHHSPVRLGADEYRLINHPEQRNALGM